MMTKHDRMGTIYGRGSSGLGGGLSGRGFAEMFDYDFALRAAHIGFCEDGTRVYQPMQYEIWCLMRQALSDDMGPPRSWSLH